MLGPWEPSGQLDRDVSADVCVIGLGGSGLAAIRRLQESDLSVVGVDAFTVAHGAAGRNGGLLLAGTAAVHHDAAAALGPEQAATWYRDTMVEITRMLEETPGLIRRTGSLRIAADQQEEDDCRAQLLSMQAAALPVEEYAGQEGRGLLFPHDAVFNPLGRSRELARRALTDGALLFEHSPVTALETGLVTTRLGRIRCHSILVAVDGNLAGLLPELAFDVRPLRLQMLATEPTHELRLSRPVYYRYGFEYWQQLQDGRLLLGGFRDAGGDGEWGGPPEPGAVVQELLERFLRDHLRVNAAITHRWAATVGYREAILPFFGPIRPGIRALGGYNGTGNVIGSMLGRRLAGEIIAAG